MTDDSINPRAFGRMEQKLDNAVILLTNLNARLDRRDEAIEKKFKDAEEATEERFEKVETRVTTIEKKQWMWSGAVGLAAFALAKFNIIADLFK